MALSAGTKLGPYEILAVIGAGGMGEVYRAKDTRLDRTVAIKVLPSHLSADPERKQRFEREARTISSLNHPHICHLYDIGSQNGTDYLVMEYLEGESLAQRLEKGSLTTELVLRYGVQIAEALDKAHRQSIIHRDLKPGNIMLTKSGAKLLDFGLAKLAEARPAGPRPGLSQSAPGQSQVETKYDPLTEEGVVLGTVQYMAPEQLEGKPADERTDIFALGEALYEMATGQRTFKGTSKAQVMAAILSSEPPSISTVQPLTPPALDRVVKKCLAKDPEARWQTARDLADELKWISEGGSQAGVTASVVPQGKTRQIFWKFSALVFVAATLLLAILYWRVPLSESRVRRLSIVPPKGNKFADAPALSPDGTLLVFEALSTGETSLWLRRLDTLTAQQLPGTIGASYPFWSPDNRFLVFYSEGKLRKIELPNGQPQVICDAAQFRGGTWNRDGMILFASQHSGLYRISQEGGTPTSITKLDPSRQETSHRWPHFLPDGKHFLYFIQSGRAENTGIYAGSLDSDDKTKLILADTSALFSAPGYVLFQRNGILMAESLDTNKLKLTGEAIQTAEPAWWDPHTWGLGGFSVSENGLLAYRTGNPNSQLLWLDRNGHELGKLGPEDLYFGTGALSPDGGKLAIEINRDQDDLWFMDTASGSMSRFTFDPGIDGFGVWSRDGTKIVFCSNRLGPRGLYEKAASGSGSEQQLLVLPTSLFPLDWSEDGRFLLYASLDPETGSDLWILPLFGDRKPIPFLQGPANEGQAKFSPDGRWIAYASDESGRAEIYVQPFPGLGGGKWQISTDGGVQPRWRRDGKELFLCSGSKIMSSEIKTSSSFEAGPPTILFEAPLSNVHYGDVNNAQIDYSVSGDGMRFLINVPVEDPGLAPIAVVENWRRQLKR